MRLKTDVYHLGSKDQSVVRWCIASKIKPAGSVPKEALRCYVTSVYARLSESLRLPKGTSIRPLAVER